MRKGPLKVSGLVASGKVKLYEDGLDSTKIEAQRDSPSSPAHELQQTTGPECVRLTNGLATDQPSHAIDARDNESASYITSSPTRAEGGVSQVLDSVTTNTTGVVLESFRGAERIPLALIDDSPYQPRKEYDPERLDELAMTMNTAGQVEPIRVRRKGSRFELISGHRRKRAALSLGWPDILASIDDKDDERAYADVLLSAIGSHGLSDWEIAGLLKVAVEDGLVSSQRQLAAWSGLNVSKVNGCLKMLELPPRISSHLERRPKLFGYETSRVILGLLKEYPDNLDEIDAGVKRLIEGKAQNMLKSWVVQQINGRLQTDESVITKAGRMIFKIRRDSERAVVVSCKSLAVDMGEFEKRLQAWLEEQAVAIADGQEPGTVA